MMLRDQLMKILGLTKDKIYTFLHIIRNEDSFVINRPNYYREEVNKQRFRKITSRILSNISLMIFTLIYRHTYLTT